MIVGLSLLLSCRPQAPKEETVKYKGEPKLVIQPENHNFGSLKAGDVISFSFKMENKGLNVLTIDSVIADCGCIDVSLESTELIPSSSCYMQVTYRSAGDWGNIIKSVQVYSNDSIGRHTVLIGAHVENQIFN